MAERKELKRKNVLAYFEALKLPSLVGLEALSLGAPLGPRDRQARPHGEADPGLSAVKAFVIRAARTMPPMRKPFARRCASPACVLCR